MNYKHQIWWDGHLLSHKTHFSHGHVKLHEKLKTLDLVFDKSHGHQAHKLTELQKFCNTFYSQTWLVGDLQ